MSPPLADLVLDLPDAAYVLDGELRYAFVNRRAATLIGAEPEGLSGTPLQDAPFPDLTAATIDGYRKALRTGLPDTFEQLHPSLDLCLQHRVAPVEDHLWVTLLDVTRQKRDEEALRRKAVVFDAAGDIVVVTDEEGTITGWNPAAEAALGYEAAEIRGRPVSLIFPLPDGTEHVREVISQVAEQEEWAGELWVARKDGTWRLLESRVRAVRDPGGRLIGTVGVNRDITEKQPAAEELAALLRAMEDVVLVIDGEGRYRRVAPTSPELLYRPSDVLVGRTFRDILPAAQADQFEAAVSTALEEQRTVQLDYSMAIDGAEHWFHAALSPMDENHVVWVARDITDRKEAESRVHQQALLFQNTNDAVIYTDGAGRISAWNPGAVQTFGHTRDEALGCDARDLLLGDQDLDQIALPTAEKLLTRGRWEGELELWRKDGSAAICECVVLPLMDEAGELTGSITVCRDVTESRSLEEQLRQSQKLEAIGRLAGGIAHDFNNMLLVIQGFTDLLENEIEPRGEAAEYLGEIRKAAERAARLTRQLLAYSRRQVLQPDLLDLNATITRFEPMIRRIVREDVVVEVDLDPGIGLVRADPAQVEQMIANLVLNAHDAMTEGGRLGIRTRQRTIPPGRPPQVPDIPDGHYVELIVEDTGHGMDPDVLQQVFEPFFTTKPTGQGTGLGLSMVYGIARQSGGFVWGESERDRGSRFHVLLPRVRDDEDPPRV